MNLFHITISLQGLTTCLDPADGAKADKTDVATLGELCQYLSGWKDRLQGEGRSVKRRERVDGCTIVGLQTGHRRAMYTISIAQSVLRNHLCVLGRQDVDTVDHACLIVCHHPVVGEHQDKLPTTPQA